MENVGMKEIAELVTAITCVEYQLMGQEGQETVEKLCRGFHILAEARRMENALIEHFDKAVEQERLDTENNRPITTKWDVCPDESVIDGMFDAIQKLHSAQPKQEEIVRWMEQFIRAFYEGTVSAIS